MSCTKSGEYEITGNNSAPLPVVVLIITSGIVLCLSEHLIFLTPTIDPAGVVTKSKLQLPT